MKPEQTQHKHQLEQLTNREKQVLMMIFNEKTNKEISQELFISKRTVDIHRRNLLYKLQVKNTVGLIKSVYKIINK